MPGIAVVGSANTDLVVRCDRHPFPGETVAGHSFRTNPGGKGANQAVAAAKLMEGRAPAQSVWFVGCVGDDAHGEALKASLAQSGVGLEHLRTVGGASTGTAVITVDSSGENTIVIDPGANAHLARAHVERALRDIDPDIVLVQLEIGDEAVYACAGHGTLVLDPAPARILDDDFLAHVDIVTPNESEALTLTGVSPHTEVSQRRAAHALLEKGPRQVVIKLGANGCYYTDGKCELRVPAPAVESVDSTAAGDAFNGALAVALAEGDDVEVALQMAVRAASLSVTKLGAQASMPTREELLDLE